MKRIILVCMLMLSTAAIAYAQVTVPADQPEIDREYFLKKSRGQRTAGWILAGSGTILVASGFVVAFSDVMETAFTGKSYNKTGEIMIIGGVACGVGSIPLFIAAGKNKKKASLSMGTQSIPVGFKPAQQFRYPSAGLIIQLGK